MIVLTNVLRRFVYALTAATLIGNSGGALAQDAKALFSEYKDRIYQIRIIERSSGKQAGLGSGFLVSADGLIVSNFHVVAEYTSFPDRYSIEYVRNSGETGALALLGLDVINDLALLKQSDSAPAIIELATTLPEHGEAIYSIGNPHDLGWTVVPGTYNGITSNSVYERIHFSGSVNPGMSGGPVLNAAGQLIGVNVATAGNQVSFLVPLNRVADFLETTRKTTLDLEDLETSITAQLKRHQQKVISALIDSPWGSVEFGEALVPQSVAEFIKCWGYSDDDADIRYSHSATTCNSEEQIYLSHNFNTGNIVYQFNWLETEELNSFQFYNMLKEKTANAYPDNDASKEDVSDYECHDDFVGQKTAENGDVVTKTSYCVREYRRFRGLYDILFFGVAVNDDSKALISHFTMAGVDRELAQDFVKKFMASVTWR